jgi:hypothetical protein
MALRGRLQKGTLVAWQGNGIACVNKTRPHYVNQMAKTQSNDLAERYGRGTAGEQQGNGMGTAWKGYGMCEFAFTVLVVPDHEETRNLKNILNFLPFGTA